MKFCPNCGASVTLKVPAGDSLPRHVCEACSTIHYANPKMVIGCIPEWESRILLCKRAIEPRRGSASSNDPWTRSSSTFPLFAGWFRSIR